MMKFIEQVQNHLLAIISLVVAVSALSYSGYRNELTEVNSNVRHAGFELLKELNQLQLLIDYAHYDKDAAQGNPITGWGHVMYIKDMSHLVSETVIVDANALGKIWSEEWESIRENSAGNERITKSIDVLRSRVRDEIAVLK